MLLSDHHARHELLRRHANSPNACATLQPFLHHFDTPHGFIAYGCALGCEIVIDDPIAVLAVDLQRASQPGAHRRPNRARFMVVAS